VTTWYDVLQVPRDASEDDIRAAHDRIAAWARARIQSGRQELVEEASWHAGQARQAYQILGTPHIREQYDAWLDAAESQQEQDFAPQVSFGTYDPVDVVAGAGEPADGREAGTAICETHVPTPAGEAQATDVTGEPEPAGPLADTGPPAGADTTPKLAAASHTAAPGDEQSPRHLRRAVLIAVAATFTALTAIAAGAVTLRPHDPAPQPPGAATGCAKVKTGITGSYATSVTEPVLRISPNVDDLAPVTTDDLDGLDPAVKATFQTLLDAGMRGTVTGADVNGDTSTGYAIYSFAGDGGARTGARALLAQQCGTLTDVIVDTDRAVAGGALVDVPGEDPVPAVSMLWVEQDRVVTAYLTPDTPQTRDRVKAALTSS
jgi:hypothetical protein